MQLWGKCRLVQVWRGVSVDGKSVEGCRCGGAGVGSGSMDGWMCGWEECGGGDAGMGV